MYAALETRTTVLTAGVVISIVVFGKMFGGALYGLIPLALCVGSGVYLWMKDLINQGRNQEWQSEKERGEVVSLKLWICYACTDVPGNRKSHSRISRMAQ